MPIIAVLLSAGCPAGFDGRGDAGPADKDAAFQARDAGSSDADAAPSLDPGYYLRGARVITGVDDAPLEGLAVLVRGERVFSIEPEAVEVPDDLVVLDLHGLTLLPGFIDAHVHMMTSTESEQLAMDLFLDFGVTTVRNLGDPLDQVLALRQQVNSGEVTGPRILAAGPAFTAPDGHPVATLYADNPTLANELARTPSSVSEARAQVRELHQAGVDLIKIVLTDCSTWNSSCERLDSALAAAVAEEALTLGLPVAVHTDTEEDALEALGIGATSLEHGVTVGPLTSSLAAEIAAQGAVYVGTVGKVAIYPNNDLPQGLARLAELRQAGARCGVGTDANNQGATWGASLFRELEYMVQAGFTPLEALEAATLVNAILLGIDDEVGSIEIGKRADLIAVPGDLLTDMTAAADVRMVMRNGQILRAVP